MECEVLGVIPVRTDGDFSTFNESPMYCQILRPTVGSLVKWDVASEMMLGVLIDSELCVWLAAVLLVLILAAIHTIRS